MCFFLQGDGYGLKITSVTTLTPEEENAMDQDASSHQTAPTPPIDLPESSQNRVSLVSLNCPVPIIQPANFLIPVLSHLQNAPSKPGK